VSSLTAESGLLPDFEELNTILLSFPIFASQPGHSVINRMHSGGQQLSPATGRYQENIG